MELSMNSKLTMHQLGMTQTRVRPQRRRTAERVPVVPDGITTPKVGTEIEINMNMVVVEDEFGQPKTPMTKLRYNDTTKQWQQVSAHLAGMLAFFDSDQPPDECTKIRIVRVIPSGRACYVVPV